MIPADLMNRTNRELTARVQQLAADIGREKSMARLEAEALKAGTQKLAALRLQAGHIESTVSRREELTRAEQSRLRDTALAVDRFASELQRLQGTGKDVHDKVSAVEGMLQRRRDALRAAEENRSKLEEFVVTWVADAAVTGQATQLATSELKAGQDNVRRLQALADRQHADARVLEDGLWEETLMQEQVRAEADGARAQIAAVKRERESAAAQLQELAQQSALSDEYQGSLQQQRAANQAAVDAARRAAEFLQAELREVQAAVQRAEGTRAALEAAKGRVTAAASSAAGGEESAVTRCEDIERELQAVKDEIQRLDRQRGDLRETAAAAAEALAKRERKREALVVRLREAAAVVAADADAGRETASMAALLEAELRDLQHAEAQGRSLLSVRRNEHMAAGMATDEVTNAVVELRRLLGQAQRTEHQLQQANDRIGATLETVEEQLAVVAAQLDAARAKQTEADTSVRQALRARAEELKAQLASLEGLCLQSRKAVDGAASALRVDGRSLNFAQEEIAALKAEYEQSAVDINRLITESEELGRLRQARAESFEALRFQVDVLRRQADGLDKGVAEQLTRQQALEARAAEEAAHIAADMDGLRVALHAHEDERHKLALRLAALQQQRGAAASRYEDRMTVVKHLMLQADKDLAPLLGAATGPTRTLAIMGGPSSSAAATATSAEMALLENTSPEDVQARVLLARALERDALQAKGDGLDSAIVKGERDLARLSAAVQQMEAGVREGRELVLREGADPDLVLFGGIGADGGGALRTLLAGPSGAPPEEELVSFIQQRLEQELTDAAEAEVQQWRRRVEELDADLAHAKAQEHKALATKAAAEGHLKGLRDDAQQLRRQLDATGRACAVDAHAAEKARAAGLQRAQQHAKRLATAPQVLQRGHTAEQFSAALERLWAVVRGTGGDTALTRLHHTAEQFGLPLPLPSAVSREGPLEGQPVTNATTSGPSFFASSLLTTGGGSTWPLPQSQHPSQQHHDPSGALTPTTSTTRSSGGGPHVTDRTQRAMNSANQAAPGPHHQHPQQQRPLGGRTTSKSIDALAPSAAPRTATRALVGAMLAASTAAGPTGSARRSTSSVGSSTPFFTATLTSANTLVGSSVGGKEVVGRSSISSRSAISSHRVGSAAATARPARGLSSAGHRGNATTATDSAMSMSLQGRTLHHR